MPKTVGPGPCRSQNPGTKSKSPMGLEGIQVSKPSPHASLPVCTLTGSWIGSRHSTGIRHSCRGFHISCLKEQLSPLQYNTCHSFHFFHGHFEPPSHKVRKCSPSAPLQLRLLMVSETTFLHVPAPPDAPPGIYFHLLPQDCLLFTPNR